MRGPMRATAPSCGASGASCGRRSACARSEPRLLVLRPPPVPPSGRAGRALQLRARAPRSPGRRRPAGPSGRISWFSLPNVAPLRGAAGRPRLDPLLPGPLRRVHGRRRRAPAPPPRVARRRLRRRRRDRRAAGPGPARAGRRPAWSCRTASTSRASRPAARSRTTSRPGAARSSASSGLIDDHVDVPALLADRGRAWSAERSCWSAATTSRRPSSPPTRGSRLLGRRPVRDDAGLHRGVRRLPRPVRALGADRGREPDQAARVPRRRPCPVVARRCPAVRAYAEVVAWPTTRRRSPPRCARRRRSPVSRSRRPAAAPRSRASRGEPRRSASRSCSRPRRPAPASAALMTPLRARWITTNQPSGRRARRASGARPAVVGRHECSSRTSSKAANRRVQLVVRVGPRARALHVAATTSVSERHGRPRSRP